MEWRNIFPFELKAPNEKYGYAHHFDKDDLYELSGKIPALTPYRPYSGETLTAWGDFTKQVLADAIRDGRFDGLYEKDGIVYDVKVVWVNGKR